MFTNEFDASRETDAFIHEKVFFRLDSPPPYSTDEHTARWLAKRFELTAMPVYEMGKARWNEALNRPDGPVVGYMMVKHCEPTGEGRDGLIFLAQSDTFALAVCRSVLLLEGWAQLEGRVTYH